MDPRVTELHCIMPIENIVSVLAHGILSYERAARLPHRSVAMQAVQDERDKKDVPGGLRLHQYANLYIHARNPMMSRRRAEAPVLCVLTVSLEVLEIPGTVLADQNAASKYVRFHHPSRWSLLDFDAILAGNWTHPGDQIAEWRHKSRKCAEVLVPHRVDPAQLTGAYVVDPAAEISLRATGFSLPIRVDPVLFFRNA